MRVAIVRACAAWFVLLAAVSCEGQEFAKRCASAEATQVEVSVVSGSKLLGGFPRIEILPSDPSGTRLRKLNEAVEVVALGPVLGSADSAQLKTEVKCEVDGLSLKATIKRFASYPIANLGSFLSPGHNWRPQVAFRVRLLQPKVVFRLIWNMRLPDGTNATHAGTPQTPDQSYPIVLTKVLSANLGGR
jgi:hypothetical protein